MKILIMILVVGLAFCSCNNSSSSPDKNSDSNKIEVTNDLENALSLIPSWVNEKTICKMENGKAHSGDFVSKVDDVNIYTYAYREYLMNISKKLPKAIYVSGWVNSPNPAETLCMILDIGDGKTPLLWKSYYLKSIVTEPNKWFEFRAGFNIDKPIKPEYLLKIYGASGGKVAYFDDFKITFEY
ncbi:MAG: hypothetical protein HXX13_08280 [Bacteroidetes bacterium]|nr:hypothetical protein [Bacteroidota bacterium]